MPTIFEFISQSSQETQKAAEVLATLFKPPMTLLLKGELGAGKTLFVSGFKEGLEETSVRERVKSPTFALALTYDTKPPLHHLDLYRIKDQVLSEELGLSELLDDEEAFKCIEWPDAILDLLDPTELVKISFSTLSEQTRSIRITLPPNYSEEATQKLKAALDKVLTTPITELIGAG